MSKRGIHSRALDELHAPTSPVEMDEQRQRDQEAGERAGERDPARRGGVAVAARRPSTARPATIGTQMARDRYGVIQCQLRPPRAH